MVKLECTPPFTVSAHRSTILPLATVERDCILCTSTIVRGEGAVKDTVRISHPFPNFCVLLKLAIGFHRFVWTDYNSRSAGFSHRYGRYSNEGYG